MVRKGGKLTVSQLLVGDSLAELSAAMAASGFEAEKLVTIGMDKIGRVRVSYTCTGRAEAIGMMMLAQNEVI